MLRARWVRVLAILAAILVVGGIATATAAQSLLVSGVIAACVDSSNGVVRIVTEGNNCKGNEYQLTWNQQGAPGVQGPVGPAGPAGPQGPSGPGATYDNPYNYTIDCSSGGVRRFGASLVEVTGLGGPSVEVVEYRSGTDAGTTIQLIPGGPKVSPAVVTWQIPIVPDKRGDEASMMARTWLAMVRNGQIASARSTCTVTMYGGSPATAPALRTWRLQNAWPSKITVPQLKNSAEVTNPVGLNFGIEQLEINYEDLTEDSTP